MAMLSASEQFSVKTIRSGATVLSNWARFLRQRWSMSPAIRASRYPLRPADAATLTAKSAIASITQRGLGKLVEELSQ